MTASQIIQYLGQKMIGREKRSLIPYSEFLEAVVKQPFLAVRNIFQLMYDMIHGHLGDGENEYPNDPESINYVRYNTNSLFVEGADNPFFADRLFANRLVNAFTALKVGTQQNKIYIFEGPHGCGKSTFLANLLQKFEEYMSGDQGLSYEVVWKLGVDKLGGFSEISHQANSPWQMMEGMGNVSFVPPKDGYIEIPCPSHDHPLLMVPKSYRRECFEDLFQNTEFKTRLNDKEYEWVFKDTPCAICQSLFRVLLDKFDSPEEVFSMIYAQRYNACKSLGQGISVFNPGDRELPQEHVLTNPMLQEQINRLLKNSDLVRYVYSNYAKTNNGIYVLQDIKDANKERFSNLHGIISERVHKIGSIEETVNSLFLAVMNPGDDKNSGEGKTKDVIDDNSFQDRKEYIKINYVLDFKTETEIYKKVFGNRVENSFLPRVLANFAKAIISSRLKESKTINAWIKEPGRYNLYCDSNLYLLKMDIYAGIIPTWLSEEDRKDFTAERRKKLIMESEEEGVQGFSGRDSLKIFSEFITAYAKDGRLITMSKVHDFFLKKNGNLHEKVPPGFLDSLINLYNYSVLEEVKTALYNYNEDRIAKDIQNYLFAINFEIGAKEKCKYTGEEVEIAEEFFASIEKKILSTGSTDLQRLNFRERSLKEYGVKTLQEIMIGDKKITDTEQYRDLKERYSQNLKETVLDPFLDDTNFRTAINDYGTENFSNNDKKIKDDVALLINNLINKSGYTEQGAKEVCVYVIDNDLARKYSKK
ncbi:MAG: serine protein kinase PrkA [bacterium]|nr:serine protein kinase PrkA [bacterium]